MAKGIAFFVLIALILSLSPTHAGRPYTAERIGSVESGESNTADFGCGGLGEEECLMRRTLAAHTDYIYTQEKPLN
ncbi:Phytosulfokine [Apostasia shenzhenica]|uniref:Phytosulfokine n=1 Tax=Apostasia shenzhenica TaxID=1088818 RepID=A0A2I0AFC5_9ASPA|nr:Phytosulfokine [Apostasia shenzhenica]